MLQDGCIQQIETSEIHHQQRPGMHSANTAKCCKYYLGCSASQHGSELLQRTDYTFAFRTQLHNKAQEAGVRNGSKSGESESAGQFVRLFFLSFSFILHFFIRMMVITQVMTLQHTTCCQKKNFSVVSSSAVKQTLLELHFKSVCLAKVFIGRLQQIATL